MPRFPDFPRLMAIARKSMTRKRATNHSPIVLARAVTPLNRLLLVVRAGGQCEFDGCNKNVLRHHVTLKEGMFGQMAHIVAFKMAGPRGDENRPIDINDVRNL